MLIKNILKGIAVGLALLVAVILFLYLNRSDPYGPLPGKRLQGEEVTERIDDWSFAAQYRTATNEVRPSNPYSVYTSFVLHDEVLYISSGLGPESRWVQFLMEEPNMRIRLGNKLYKVRGTLVEDPMLIDAIHKTREQKNPRLAERTPQQRSLNLYFRIDSR